MGSRGRWEPSQPKQDSDGTTHSAGPSRIPLVVEAFLAPLYRGGNRGSDGGGAVSGRGGYKPGPGDTSIHGFSRAPGRLRGRGLRDVDKGPRTEETWKTRDMGA